MIREPFDTLYDRSPFDPATRAITVQADYITTPPGTWYFSRRFNFPDGDYVFQVQVDDGGSLWLGRDALSVSIIASADLGTLDGTAQVSMRLSGEYRLDMILTNTPGAPSPAFFALQILRPHQAKFYVSSKADWLMDESPIADADLDPVSDYRLALPVFSVLPNWKKGITERLSWQTDVLSSESDAEQRRSVRRHPRRSFEAEFLRTGSQRARLDFFFVGVGKSPFMLPIWHEQLSIITGISVESPRVLFEGKDGQLREFRNNDLVFISNGDPADYDILKITNVTNDGFDWQTPPLRKWPRGTRVYPMREARLLDDPQATNYNESVASVQCRFDLSQPDVRTASWGAAIGGEPYLHVRPNWKEPVQLTYTRRNYAMDNTSGVIAVTDSGRYTTIGMRFNAMLFGREDAYAFRQFLASARGMARHFYAPSYTHDLQPVSDIFDGDLQIVTQPSGYPQYMSRPQPSRLTMVIFLGDGVDPIYRKITAAESIYKKHEDGSLVVPPQTMADLFSFETPLPAIALKHIQRISFVTETRFDQDTFEIHHPVNGQRVIDISLALRQSQNPRKVPV